MIDAFKVAGAKLLLVSGGFTFFTARLQDRLGFDATLSNTLETVDGRLTGRVTGSIVDAGAKAAAVRHHGAAVRGTDGLVVAIGDGANDLPMLAEADVSIAYRAKPAVRVMADHAIDHCGLDAILNLFA
jgi:phosphoserine phosphatase